MSAIVNDDHLKHLSSCIFDNEVNRMCLPADGHSESRDSSSTIVNSVLFFCSNGRRLKLFRSLQSVVERRVVIRADGWEKYFILS